MRYVNHKNKNLKPGAGYAIPFFVVLAALTVVSFIIPLRPTRSESEKRNLAQFPEFSAEALVSGSYFDDISTWFSDTFPGREDWLLVSAKIEEYHGHSDIIIHGDLNPITPETTVPATTVPEESTVPETTVPEETVHVKDLPPIILEEIAPPTDPVEEWGGLNAGEAEINLGAVIQIDDYAFNYFGFSEYTSERYANMVNRFVEKMADTDVNIISAPCPTAIGVMVENEYMELLKCEPQDEALEYLHSFMDDRVVKVDTVNALIAHNDEYLYFRTDHHWTALGAYYSYVACMEALGYEPASLEEDFELWDQGEFRGSLYYECSQSSKLRLDNVYAYNPLGEITAKIYPSGYSGFDWTVLTDMSKNKPNSKYMTFLAGDNALTIITNDSIPDAPNCVILKDSYGNCFAPFLTQNYHKVYVVDYREYSVMRMPQFAEEYDIQDIFLIPNLGATQSTAVIDLMGGLCR